MDYQRTLARVEDYFDQTATETWARLTSDAPVSRVRQTVREGRDQMRARLRAQLPADISGMRILDAGCGTGQFTAELAEEGAEVVAVDISPALIDIARARLPAHLVRRVQFMAGDLQEVAGPFDATVAMDSLIYYKRPDLLNALARLTGTSAQVVFTVAPLTPLLWMMWQGGKLFPRGDKSPVMTPHAPARLRRDWTGGFTDLGRVSRGFYISHALEVRG